MSEFDMKAYIAKNATRDPKERIDELLAANTRLEQENRDLRLTNAKINETAKAAIEKLGVVVVREARQAAANLPTPVSVTNISRAVEDVLDERGRQRRAGFDAGHDDQHVKSELVRAAAIYALNYARGDFTLMHRLGDMLHQLQPWAMQPGSDARRNIVIAAALLIAELERIDRTYGSALADRQARAG